MFGIIWRVAFTLILIAIAIRIYWFILIVPDLPISFLLFLIGLAGFTLYRNIVNLVELILIFKAYIQAKKWLKNYHSLQSGEGIKIPLKDPMMIKMIDLEIKNQDLSSYINNGEQGLDYVTIIKK